MLNIAALPCTRSAREAEHVIGNQCVLTVPCQSPDERAAVGGAAIRSAPVFMLKCPARTIGQR